MPTLALGQLLHSSRPLCLLWDLDLLSPPVQLGGSHCAKAPLGPALTPPLPEELMSRLAGCPAVASSVGLFSHLFIQQT